MTYDINMSSGDAVVFISATGFDGTSGIAEKLADTGKASGLYTNKECTTELTTAADPIYMRVK
ncbi:hypothetical protein SDC9_53771 [bioreactor metagenome]|uniref:Uncharacterized protein n=1 Tax=bioreactor metagenome TaxID=1076179 RepID=A0A644WU60_9ZZZZ